MKITNMQTRTFWKGEYGISAQVEDSGLTYDVRLDVKGTAAEAFSCTCPEGRSGLRMCAHSRAVLQKYKDQLSAQSGMPISTSVQVRNMIREYTNRDVAEIEREQKEEKVDLLPRLLFRKEEICVEFHIARDRSYVIRDLLAFCKAVEQGAYVEYGKNLAFHHEPDNFTERSRKLLNLMVELVETYREHYEMFHKSGYGNTMPILRELTISKANRDRLFRILEGMTVQAEDANGMPKELRILKKNPPVKIHVRPAGNRGMKVYLDRNIISFNGERTLYVCDDSAIYICDQEFEAAARVFLEQMTQGFGAPYEVLIHEKDTSLFYERVLRKLEAMDLLDVEEIMIETLRPVELSADFRVESTNPGEIRLQPTLHYGEYSFHPMEDEHVPKVICRDVPGEFRISRVLTRYFKDTEPETKDLLIRKDEDAIYAFLSKGVEELRLLGNVLISEEVGHMRIIQQPRISVGVRTTGEWLNLTIDAGDLTGADLQKILEAYHQKKKFYRLKNGEFLQLEENGLMTVARMMDGMTISKGDLKEQTFQVPRFRALYLDALYREQKNISFIRDQSYTTLVRNMKSVEDSDFQVPEEFRNVLRGYQKTGFRWLRTLDSCGFGGILADDMGLGKTLQIITLIADEYRKNPESRTLIVCPASLVYNWEGEFQNFAPNLKLTLVVGNAAEREEILNSAADSQVIITSYDLLKRDIQLYADRTFRFQVIDEAQYIKNPNTQSAKSVKMIHAQTRFALTGTPVENRLSELWSIFDYLMPGFLYSYQKFRKELENQIVKEKDPDALKRLQLMTAPFILRRMKKDVLKELPDKLETVIYSRMAKTQKELYTAAAWKLKDELESSSKLEILTALTRIRQICCDPHLVYQNYKGESSKLETCISIIQSGIEGGHKILLFSQFTSMLDIIRERLQKEEIPSYVLTGATPKEERIRLVNAFQHDEIPVFLISLKAGGTGLNLTAADMVIHYDPWWNVAAQNQATDRAYRIGQEKEVSVFQLITRDTIEENILKLQQSKQLLAEEVVSEGMLSLGDLSEAQLRQILS